MEVPVYLKIQGGQLPSNTVRHEARVLSQLETQGLPSIPPVLASGQLVGHGLGFSILGGWRGNKKKRRFRSAPAATCQLQGALDWLGTLNALETREIASILPKGLTGRFLPSFDPLTEGLVACDKLENSSNVRFVRDCLQFAAGIVIDSPSPCIIHGSFTVFNILADHNSLGGFVDFESTRSGDRMEEYGSLGYYLAQEVSEKCSLHWMQLAMRHHGRARFVTRVIPFMLWFALARTNLQKVRWNRIRRLIDKLDFLP